MSIDLSKTIFTISSDQFILSKNDLTTIFLSFIVCAGLFHLLDFFLNSFTSTTKKRYDTIERILTIGYNIFALSVGYYDYFFNDSKCGYYNSEFQQFILCLSFGFFLFDYLYSYVYGILDFNRIVHHSVVIIAEYELLILRTGGYLMLRWGIFLELNGLPMQMRMILNNLGKKDTKLFLLFESGYFSSYVLSRVLYLRFFVNYCYECNENIILMPIAGVCLLLQAVQISITMFKITKSRIKELKERMNKGINLYWIDVNPEVYDLNYNHKHHNKERLDNQEKKHLEKAQ